MAGGNSASGARRRHRRHPSACLGRPTNHPQPPHGEVCAACDWLSWASAPGRHAAATFPAPLVRVRAIPTGKRSRASPPRPPARASAPSPFRVGPSRQRSSKHRGQQRAVRTQVCSGAIGVWKMPPDGGLGLQLR